MLLGSPVQSMPPDLHARLSSTVLEFTVGHGVEILGTTEVRYGVGAGIEWGRPGRILRSGDEVAVREHAHFRVFRSFTGNEGFDGVVAGLGVRWHILDGRMKNGYFEAGSGISVSDGVSIDVNHRFNFVSYVGGGVFLDSSPRATRLGLRWVHVSNANIEPPNRGLNQFEAVIGLRF